MPLDLFGEASDSSLVVAVGRRTERALEELYSRHASAVFGLARRITRDETLAADVTQEVFVKLWERPERFDAERGTLRSYLLANAHGRSVDVVRSEQARKLREERDVLDRPSVDAATSEDEALAAIESEALREALSGLTDEERRAINLAYFGGRSYREVAAILGEPEGTVKSRIRSGLSRLSMSFTAVWSMIVR